MSMTEKEVKKKTNEVFKKWYGSNKEEYNEKRKARYHTDPEYRERVKERARIAKAEKLKRRKKIIGDAVERDWKGAKLLVYRIGSVSSKIGCTDKVILDFENRGIIPPPILGGKHRTYTQNQIDLIKDLYDEIQTADNYHDVKMIENSRKLTIKSSWGEGL